MTLDPVYSCSSWRTTTNEIIILFGRDDVDLVKSVMPRDTAEYRRGMNGIEVYSIQAASDRLMTS